MLRERKKYITRVSSILKERHADLVTHYPHGYDFYYLFENSRMVIFYKSGHFPHLDESEKFIRVVNDVTNN